MKLLLLRTYNMFAETGASANRWRTMVEGLSKFDVKIVIIITGGYKSVDEYKKYGKKGSISSNIQYSYSTFQLHSNIWFSRINIYLLAEMFSIFNVFFIKRTLNDIKPDIVFLFPGLDIFRIIAKIFPKAHGELKLMMEINEYNDIWDVYITNRSQKKNCMQFNHYLSKTIFPQLDICLVMTESLLKYYSQFPNINPKIAFLKLPMTVDLYRFEDVPNKFNLEKPYIAYCGSSSFYKDGVDILIKSFAEVSSEYFDLKLYIAAFWEKDGPKMMRLIHDTGLEDKIIYLGIVNRDEIPPLIMNAKILALPRPDSRQAQGGFPTKLGEYLASGNPVCITRIGEITDYLVDNESAFIAEPGDIESFINALKRVLSDEVNAKRVGKNGRKVAEMHFNMDVQAGRLYNFLIETLH